MIYFETGHLIGNFLNDWYFNHKQGRIIENFCKTYKMLQSPNHLKALMFLYAFEASVDCHLLSSFCDDSNLHISLFNNICKATTVTHTKRIYRNLLRKETSFVYYTSSVLRKSRHMKQKEKITHCC